MSDVNPDSERIVLEHLRDQIVSGKLKASTKLPSERALCQTLGVSRGYVRKALAKLEHYGLIRTLPQRGTIVAGLGSKAISGLIASIGSLDEDFGPVELFEIRALLETFAARKAAERAGADDITEILKWHSEFRIRADAGQRGLEEDHLFHLAIARASGNPVCLALTSYFTPQIISLNADYAESDPDRFRRTFAEHDAIVRAILAGDPDVSAEAMRSHMEEAWKRRLPERSPR
ncbi:MAG TPA: FadR/GntR family transcriptional regulator [Spirochaetia bacterium]|nr:FadR/GntR family transcriptional regulator [Spirochaetales bacterium]HRY80481.1 FadR/GntR family transcriptional regulator [Spirochaetia bacterium]